MGFRLSSDPLVSVTNVNPLVFDTNNPGKTIFGWEIPYGAPPLPEGIEANCLTCSINNLALFGGQAATLFPGTANEIFSAMGSAIIATPGPVTFLRIVAKGPNNGGPQTSTIQWLGVYGVGSNKGRITQVTGGTSGGPYTTGNFDTFAGSATQFVPEPATAMLLGLALVAMPMRWFRLRAVRC